MQQHSVMPGLARELDQSTLIMSDARELRLCLETALPIMLEFTIVSMLKMLVWDAKVW